MVLNAFQLDLMRKVDRSRLNSVRLRQEHNSPGKAEESMMRNFDCEDILDGGITGDNDQF